MYGTMCTCMMYVWDNDGGGWRQSIFFTNFTLSHRRKPMCGRVEVVSIPPPMTLQQIEHLLTQFGPVLKMEIEESDFGMKKIVATFECQESSQRAAATYGDEHCTPRVSM
ncbi:hypothetical protein GBAR_LOCUS3212 [Geodia barretti]|uniref:RRM domain-containing protein n=1 Tax=Geodia barretti TaxID=519541 RepID=A0AA35W055_GEOBA|nr:hypothetical protein GBAR_LOCUS3212 [Geodia barretti]